MHINNRKTAGLIPPLAPIVSDELIQNGFPLHIVTNTKILISHKQAVIPSAISAYYSGSQ